MAEPTPPGTEPGEGQSPESLVGTVLAGRYRLVKLLGWGAMGVMPVGPSLAIARLMADATPGRRSMGTAGFL